MKSLIEFLSFADPNIRFVVLGSVLLTATSAMVGTFTFLNKKSLIGDAISHAVLPGVCLAFLLSGTRNPLYLIAGAFATGWLSTYLVDLITRSTRIKEDTAIGLVLSVFFGIGIFMLTIIQKSGNAAQSGLDHFLFGQAAAMVGQDVFAFGAVALALVVTVVLLFKELTLVAFDKSFASVIGMPVRAIETILTSMVVFAVVIGIQAVGVVLMAAILITPAAAARFWTHNIRTMIVLASVFGAVSGISGAYISYIAPGMPTGPWIVIVISVIAFVSFFLAPRRGVFSRAIKQSAFRRTINEENILKAFYQLGERDREFLGRRMPPEIMSKRAMDERTLRKILERLSRQGYLKRAHNLWELTEEGLAKAQRVVRIHRLWELYLTTRLHIAPDHVHDDADTIEHFLTPELEAALERELNYPREDPHKSEIPYGD